MTRRQSACLQPDSLGCGEAALIVEEKETDCKAMRVDEDELRATGQGVMMRTENKR